MTDQEYVRGIPAMVEELGLPLDELRSILAEAGHADRPEYAAENEERDYAIFVELAPLRQRVNRQVLR